MARDPIVWQRFEWKSGVDCYTFEIQQGGLFGTLKAPGERVTTLPMVAWEGLMESVRVARKAHAQPQSRALAAGLPARSGARWTDAETEELLEGFKSGRSVGELADHHARTAYAIELQLDKLGLWMRQEDEAALLENARASVGGNVI